MSEQMTPGEIVGAFKINWTAFLGLPKEMREWAKSHEADLRWVDNYGGTRLVVDGERNTILDGMVLRLPPDYPLPEEPVTDKKMWNEERTPFKDMPPAVQMAFSEWTGGFEHVCAGANNWTSCLCDFLERNSRNAEAPHRIKGGRPQEFERVEIYCHSKKPMGRLRAEVSGNWMSLEKLVSLARYDHFEREDGSRVGLGNVAATMHSGRKVYAVLRKEQK